MAYETYFTFARENARCGKSVGICPDHGSDSAAAVRLKWDWRDDRPRIVGGNL
ncbi:MAG: hypothetical protein KDA59_09670 [Planctomycetales bacterium]|nr:hypothetical protein [Planctomycetales bacterium]